MGWLGGHWCGVARRALVWGSTVWFTVGTCECM